MNHARSGFLFVFAMATTARFAIAADLPATGPKEADGAKDAGPAMLETATSPAAPRPRILSPEMAAQLTSLAPKFENVTPPKPADVSLDLREVDKPRNTIVRLPPYLVPEPKPPPIMKEREIMTPKARLELALKKHPGLRFGSFWIFSNNGIALAMLEEEERLERKREFEDLASLMHIDDPAAQAKVKQEVQRAFLRPADFGRQESPR